VIGQALGKRTGFWGSSSYLEKGEKEGVKDTFLSQGGGGEEAVIDLHTNLRRWERGAQGMEIERKRGKGGGVFLNFSLGGEKGGKGSLFRKEERSRKKGWGGEKGREGEVTCFPLGEEGKGEGGERRSQPFTEITDEETGVRFWGQGREKKEWYLQICFSEKKGGEGEEKKASPRSNTKGKITAEKQKKETWSCPI